MSSAQKILDSSSALSLRNQWKAEGKQVVFSNGCFDILHLGHVDYLEKAKALGDKLIVGLNTDESVQRLKGPSRPLNPSQARARVLAALGFVDAVVLFDEDTPLVSIKTLSPDILVKGNDYQMEEIVGAKEVMASGGKVSTIPLVEGFSTTNTIQKILNN